MNHKPKRPVLRRAFITELGTATLIATSSRPILGANDRIGLGVIGCGERGRSHIQLIKQLKESGEAVEITALCDIYRPRSKKLESEASGQFYMHHQELLQDPRVDAVLIATPDHWHGYQVLDAIDAGKDVFCEKPITHWRQRDLTRRLFDTVRDRNRVVQVGVQSMSSSAWRQAAKLIQRGDIGRPLHVQAGYFCNRDMEKSMPIEDPQALPGKDLLWDVFLGDSPNRTYNVSRFFQWKLYWDYAGGPSTCDFPLVLTPIVRMLEIAFPEAVMASGGCYFSSSKREVPDTFNMMIDYLKGPSVVLTCTVGNDTGIPLLIRGSEGTLMFDRENIRIVPQPNSKRPQKIDPIQRKESLMELWRNFLSCCHSRKPVWSPLELAYLVQTTLQMGVIALQERRVIRFNRENGEFII